MLLVVSAILVVLWFGGRVSRDERVIGRPLRGAPNRDEFDALRSLRSSRR